MGGKKSSSGKKITTPSKRPFVSEDAQVSLDYFSPLVAGIAAEQAEKLNADPDVVRVNAVRGVDAIRPHLAKVAESLPLLDVNDFLELPELALALGFVVNRIFTPASPKEISARQAVLRPVRSQTLRYLEVAAELGLVPGSRVKKIRANSGPLDEAHDGVSISALFIDFAAALAGKHPFTAEALKGLRDNGNWLAHQLQPSGAPGEKAERSPDALLRDRLWTDLMRRHDLLYQAGVVIWGRRKVDEHIPSLHSRVSPAAKAPAAPAIPPK